MSKSLCLIQARLGSTRLPGKVLMEVNGVPFLEYQINRIRQTKKIDKIVVVTSLSAQDDRIEELCRWLKVDCFRGSQEDVLDRYYRCSLQYPEYENIVRSTADCPLIDPKVIDQVIEFFEQNDFDYASNVLEPTFPDGMDIEIFTRETLEQTAKEAKLDYEREHVNEYMFSQDKFKKGNYAGPADYSRFRLTLDRPEDFEVIKFLMENCPITAGYLDYIELLGKNPEIMSKNLHIKRNEGLIK